jgi:hypothetical protein
MNAGTFNTPVADESGFLVRMLAASLGRKGLGILSRYSTNLLVRQPRSPRLPQDDNAWQRAESGFWMNTILANDRE